MKSTEFSKSNSPWLEHLAIEYKGSEAAARIQLDLPNLQTLDFEHTQASLAELCYWDP